jgi:ketosteroid isomerase-like protein
VDKRYDEIRMGPRTKSLLIALCMSLVAASAGAQQATKTSTVPPAFKEMQQVEDRWNDAVTKRDQYGLELVLAPQFIGISATGDVATRNQQIAQLLVKGAGPDSLEQKVVSVRFVGDIAIVNGTYVISWKTDKGPVLEKGIFSHVFEHVRTNWLCLNSQRTVVAEDSKRVAAQEKPKAKSSNAQLPMHIPLVYKGPDSTQPPPKPGTDQPPQ